MYHAVVVWNSGGHWYCKFSSQSLCYTSLVVHAQLKGETRTCTDLYRIRGSPFPALSSVRFPSLHSPYPRSPYGCPLANFSSNCSHPYCHAILCFCHAKFCSFALSPTSEQTSMRKVRDKHNRAFIYILYTIEAPFFCSSIQRDRFSLEVFKFLECYWGSVQLLTLAMPGENKNHQYKDSSQSLQLTKSLFHFT